MNAIDAETRAILSSVLDDLRAEGKTAIIATHDIDRIESEYDDILYLADGRQVSLDKVAGHRHGAVLA
jgi:manganese/zinc/iron transport system ATP- binding protein